MVVLDPLAGRRRRRVVVDEVDLAADDRLDPGLARGLVELDRAVHHAVVGEPERGLPERGGALDEAVDLRGAVEQRVLGVDVEVGAGGGGHGGPLILEVREDAFGRASPDVARYSLRRRQAIRDCSVHSSMNPGEAVCEKRPPDAENDASAWS